jgi:hypothetical protein
MQATASAINPAIKLLTLLQYKKDLLFKNKLAISKLVMYKLKAGAPPKADIPTPL